MVLVFIAFDELSPPLSESQSCQSRGPAWRGETSVEATCARVLFAASRPAGYESPS